MIDWGDVITIPSNVAVVDTYRVIHLPVPADVDSDDVRVSLLLMNLSKWPVRVGLHYNSPGPAAESTTTLGTEPHTKFMLLSDDDAAMARGASGMLLDGRNLKAVRYISISVPLLYPMGISDKGLVNLMVWPQRWRIEANTED